MAKSRAFSIYLLKGEVTPENALEGDHPLSDNVTADDLPEDALIFILDGQPRPPWWRSYFRIHEQLNQSLKGALVFLPAGERWFVLSFGHVAHNLKDTSYEYDFGLRVTLNSLDPQKLKSTDTLEPGAAKRRRTQLPTESELTYFDFDRDSTILRSLSGKVRQQLQHLFKHASGSSSLRISTDIGPGELAQLCRELLVLYESDAYQDAFPEIQNIVPVRDPSRISALNDKLINAFVEKDANLNITVPDIINYNDNLYVMFSGAGQSLIYDDAYIGKYYEYLERGEIELNQITVELLKRHKLILSDEAGNTRDHHSIYKSLVFDTTLNEFENETFHLCEGNWYQVDNDYVARLQNFIDPRCIPSDLPVYNHENEGAYNRSVPGENPAVICLDETNISPPRQTQIEPCDLLGVRDGMATFYHIKISTLSAQLSHLFNQALNAVEIIQLEPESLERLNELIRNRLAGEASQPFLEKIANRNYRIVFGVVTGKDPARNSLNLPLFSRIGLMRSMKVLQSMGLTSNLMFIRDNTIAGDGRKKPRKRKDAQDG